MRTRWLRAAGALAPIAFALGCRDDAASPTAPTPPSPAANASAAVVLAFGQVSGGEYHTCGVTTDNQAYCWGYNQWGQLGDGTDTGPELCTGAVGPFPCSTRPVLVAGGHRFRQVSAAGFHTCGVTTDYRVYCWGPNSAGQLGDGTTTQRLTPVAVAGGRQFRQVDVGYSHTCGVTTDNRAFCWGSNVYGQLGDGTTSQRLTPVAVAGGLTFRQVSAGTGHYNFTCGVTTANRAYCWGRNNYGQLGDSTTAARRVRPSPVVGGRQYRQVDAGYYHACGVTTDNRAFCWGNGNDGQLGNNKTYLSFWPRAVRGGLSFTRVTAGNAHTCGETIDNRAFCWGSNVYGQLGDGTNTQRLVPVAVAGGLYFKQVSAGGRHTCGKTSFAVAYCWGSGFFGQLGNGTTSDRSRPTAVAGAM
jgi:alpha-tubulin suppressor-like RCC1 family protein